MDYSILKLYDKKTLKDISNLRVRPVVWVFLDERLKVREEEDYLNRIETHLELGYTIDGFHRNQARFGTISLLMNLKDALLKAYSSILKAGSK